MREGPSEPADRSRFQTTSGGCGQKLLLRCKGKSFTRTATTRRNSAVTQMVPISKRRPHGVTTAGFVSCDDKYPHTSPGSFRPNKFGLYDMAGNVGEWVDDCYHDTTETLPIMGARRQCAVRARRSLDRGQFRIDRVWTETQLLACSKLCRRRHESAQHVTSC